MPTLSFRRPIFSARVVPAVLAVAAVLAVLPASARAASADSAISAPTTQRQYLSGHGPEDAVSWEFFCTAGRNSRAWTKIGVPSCWEFQGFGTYNYGGESNSDEHPVGNEQGLYRTTFSVPAAWREQLVRIVFDGVMTDATVWINGRLAGETHQGAFYRFHYDITALLKFDAPNLLEVTVAKVSGNRSVNNAERASDYWIFGGIFRPVWLEARPKLAFERVAIDARADGSFHAELHLAAAAVEAVSAEVQLLDAASQPVGAPLSASIAAGADRGDARGRLEAPKLWTAETPNLYRAQFTLRDAQGRAVHSHTERFGFRTIEVRENDGVYLNGTKIVLKGVNRHCFWPETGRTVSREQSYADARLIKEGNMNAVRCSHYSPDEHFLEACDELGLYVLDELAGWQKSYNTPTGARLIGELIRRDVNHPSIVFWDNGNEGGWNEKNDGEFAKWDPQQRKVLHPWAIHDGINTDHYEKYDSTVKLSAGPQIFMPTEFLHGLYDGGIGAGFRDYWDVMGRSPTVAGGFFWVWSDEGAVRVDQNGRIDNAGNQAPDGMVGPHREKEGSYFAVKEIWSPVIVRAPAAEKNGGVLPADWDGVLEIENLYDFTDLSACTLTTKIDREDGIWLARSVAPQLAPRQKRTITVPRPEKWQEGAVFGISCAARPSQDAWNFTWPIAQKISPAQSNTPVKPVTVKESADEIELRSEQIELAVSRATGGLVRLKRGEKTWQPTKGPHVIAYRYKNKLFETPLVTPKLNGVRSIPGRHASEAAQVVVTLQEPDAEFTWSIDPDGNIRLQYRFDLEGDFDLLGIAFDYPEAAVKAKRWLGRGPYRVWRNRQEGVEYGLHEVSYNDPVPGESFTYPEFKGYFRDWRWLELGMTPASGGWTRIRFENENDGTTYFGLFRPKDGVKGLMELPDVGIAFLDVIPAIGTKFQTPETTGPQGVTPRVSGRHEGVIRISLAPE